MVLSRINGNGKIEWAKSGFDAVCISANTGTQTASSSKKEFIL